MSDGKEVSAPPVYPDRCPRCGAGTLRYNKMEQLMRYSCRSTVSEDGYLWMSDACLISQRDKLAARVKELEDESADYIKLNADLKAENANLAARVKELEEAGDAMRKALDRFDGRGMDNSVLREWDPAEIEGLTVGDLWRAAFAAVRWDKTKESKP